MAGIPKTSILCSGKLKRSVRLLIPFGKSLIPGWAILCFDRYMKHAGAAVSRAEYEANFLNKLRDPVFLEDIKLLVMSEVEYETANAAKTVHRELIARLSGEPWKGI
jgi:hypothetical protein